MTRRPVTIAATLLAAAGLAACGASGHARTSTIPATAAASKPLPAGTLTIYASLALQGPSTAQSQSVADAELLALEQAGGRIDGHPLRYIVMDNSTAAAQGPDPATVRQNAETAAGDPSTIAYLGEDDSGVTADSIPILNRAGILQVSPTATAPQLTLGGKGPYALSALYPTGTRTFARVVPNDDLQALAQAQYQAQEGCHRVFLLDDGGLYGEGLANGVRGDDAGVDLAIAGTATVPADGDAFSAALAKVARSGADCVFYGGDLDGSTGALWESLAATSPTLKLFGGDALATSAFTGLLSPSEQTRTFLTSPGLAPNAYGDLGAQFFEEYEARYGGFPDPEAIFGYEAMAATLSAIKAAGPNITRSGVIHGFFSIHDRESVLGTYSIDANGDTTLSTFGAYIIQNGALVFSHTLNPAI